MEHRLNLTLSDGTSCMVAHQHTPRKLATQIQAAINQAVGFLHMLRFHDSPFLFVFFAQFQGSWKRSYCSTVTTGWTQFHVKRATVQISVNFSLSNFVNDVFQKRCKRVKMYAYTVPALTSRGSKTLMASSLIQPSKLGFVKRCDWPLYMLPIPSRSHNCNPMHTFTCTHSPLIQ